MGGGGRLVKVEVDYSGREGVTIRGNGWLQKMQEVVGGGEFFLQCTTEWFW